MDKLNTNTLVLNKNWYAIQITTVRRAISLLYQGQAKAIDADFQIYNFSDWLEVSKITRKIQEDDFIYSTNLKLKIPRVVALVYYDRVPKTKIKFNRKNIFERDKYTCMYCGKKPPNRSKAIKWMEDNQLNIDHVLPRSRGGKTIWENVVVSCCSCNYKKADKTLQELNWTILKMPDVPKWHPTLHLPIDRIPHKQWENFLDFSYWHTELENDVTDLRI